MDECCVSSIPHLQCGALINSAIEKGTIRCCDRIHISKHCCSTNWTNRAFTRRDSNPQPTIWLETPPAKAAYL